MLEVLVQSLVLFWLVIPWRWRRVFLAWRGIWLLLVGVVGSLLKLLEVWSFELDSTLRVYLNRLLLHLFELVWLLLFQIIISVVSLHVGRWHITLPNWRDIWLRRLNLWMESQFLLLPLELYLFSGSLLSLVLIDVKLHDSLVEVLCWAACNLGRLLVNRWLESHALQRFLFMLFNQCISHFLLNFLVLVHSLMHRRRCLLPSISQLLTSSVEPRREQLILRGVSGDPFEVLFLLGLKQNFLPEDAHVIELLVNQRDLFVIKRESFSVAELFDSVELIDDQCVSILVVYDVQALT